MSSVSRISKNKILSPKKFLFLKSTETEALILKSDEGASPQCGPIKSILCSRISNGYISEELRPKHFQNFVKNRMKYFIW